MGAFRGAVLFHNLSLTLVAESSCGTGCVKCVGRLFHVRVLLMQLQQELKKVEAVIDTVVDTHHLGFNQAVERYSKIITLFNECKEQVSVAVNTLCARL
jgi:hypothetical protein